VTTLRLEGGVVPPIATPLHDDRSLDVDSLLRLAGALVGAGAAGIFALGSTGEAVYLDDPTRRLVVDALSREHSDLPVIAGILGPTANRCLAAARNLDGLRVTAFVATGPFYAKASAEEIYDHFAVIAAGVSAPLLAYNIPTNVGYELPVAVAAALIRDGVIAGIKDSSTDLAGLRSLVGQSHPERTLYLTGADGALADALSAGANGSVAGLANVAPHLFLRAIAAHRCGDAGGLAQAQSEIRCLARIYSATSSVSGLNSDQIGAIKTALVALGVIATDQVSLPMRRSSAARRDFVTSVLRECGIRSRLPG
jgi:4-hydroxy-tetrahydrodipicolinate synthase